MNEIEEQSDKGEWNVSPDWVHSKYKNIWPAAGDTREFQEINLALNNNNNK